MDWSVSNAFSAFSLSLSLSAVELLTSHINIALRVTATQDEAGVQINVGAIAGSGEFQLLVTIEGTIEHLAPEAVTIPPATTTDVTTEIECLWADECTYRYDGEEVRGSGTRFELRLHGVAGLTYTFLTELLAAADGSAPVGTHFSVSIYHQDAVGGGDGAEPIHDAEFALGTWTTAGQTYASLHHCTDDPDHPGNINRVPCGGDENDIGDFRTHPSGSFETLHEFQWPCAATGHYFIEITANCDVPFFADTSRCSQQADGEWQCQDPQDSQCSSRTRVQIDVQDQSTTVIEQTTMTIDDLGVLIPGSETQAEFASMFSIAQHPAIAYVAEIVPVGLGDCTTHPCQHGGICDDMPLSTVDGQPDRKTYRCRCSPSWTGANCDVTIEEEAQMASMFDMNHPIAPGGGGHRRAQGAEPEPEPEPVYAAVTLHARGQTAALATDHLAKAREKYNDRHGVYGPGADTSDGIPLGQPPAPAPIGPQFAVESGPCEVSSAGRCVGRSDYANNEACTIISLSATTLADCPRFDTEAGYDFLTIDGQRYEGTQCPTGLQISSSSTISWASDGSVTRGGWEICAEGDDPCGGGRRALLAAEESSSSKEQEISAMLDKIKHLEQTVADLQLALKTATA